MEGMEEMAEGSNSNQEGMEGMAEPPMMRMVDPSPRGVPEGVTTRRRSYGGFGVEP